MSKGALSITWILVVVLTVAGALYALGVLAIPQQVTRSDAHGTTFSGFALGADFVGPVRVTFEDGSTWDGELKDGLFEGFGTFASAQGWTYTGEFENGDAVGAGRFDFADGSYALVGS